MNNHQPDLTAPEIEILRFQSTGNRTSEIAKRPGLNFNSAGKPYGAIKTKSGAKTVAELAALAHRYAGR